MELKYDAHAWAVVAREAKAALYCYLKATTLRKTHYVLLVEQGTIAYALHSFFSRALKHVSLFAFFFVLFLVIFCFRVATN